MNRYVAAIASAVAHFLALTGAASAAGDPANGEKIFKRKCAICHTIEAGKNKVGPSLAGVVGRKAGSVEGFHYSAANKGSDLTWDEATLDKYLTSPKDVVKGTTMAFPGLKDPNERVDLIAYLRALK